MSILVDHHIGALLRARRRAIGWTVADVADRLDLAPADLLSFEAGAARPSPV